MEFDLPTQSTWQRYVGRTLKDYYPNDDSSGDSNVLRFEKDILRTSDKAYILLLNEARELLEGVVHKDKTGLSSLLERNYGKKADDLDINSNIDSFFYVLKEKIAQDGFSIEQKIGDTYSGYLFAAKGSQFSECFYNNDPSYFNEALNNLKSNFGEEYFNFEIIFERANALYIEEIIDENKNFLIRDMVLGIIKHSSYDDLEESQLENLYSDILKNTPQTLQDIIDIADRYKKESTQAIVDKITYLISNKISNPETIARNVIDDNSIKDCNLYAILDDNYEVTGLELVEEEYFFDNENEWEKVGEKGIERFDFDGENFDEQSFRNIVASILEHRIQFEQATNDEKEHLNTENTQNNQQIRRQK